MKTILKNLTFTAVLFFVAATAAFCGFQLNVSSYQECRCKQSSPNTGNDDELCCSSLALGKAVYSTYTASYCCNGKYGGYGVVNDSRCCTGADAGKIWIRGVCKTLCPESCPSGQTSTGNGYQEDSGGCCTAASLTCGPNYSYERWDICSSSNSSSCGSGMSDFAGDPANPATSAQITALQSTASKGSMYYDVKYAKDMDTGTYAATGNGSQGCSGGNMTGTTLAGSINQCSAANCNNGTIIGSSDSSKWKAAYSCSNLDGSAGYSNSYGIKICYYSGTSTFYACVISPAYYYREYYCS
ncbi:MAG: hypothetical protein LBI01_02090 [Elusimicrobium sp.]|nr:hypothetical protein [Elusimicrobium sp.]